MPGVWSSRLFEKEATCVEEDKSHLKLSAGSEKETEGVNEKPIKDVLRAVAVIIVAFLLSLAIYKAVNLTLGTSMNMLYVPTPSMEPNISVGDVVIIRGVEPQEVKPGDVIVYVTRRSMVWPDPIVHRVVAVERKNGHYYFVTKGDNNIGPDPWSPISEVYGDRILGKVIFVIPKVGYLAMAIQSPMGKVFSAIVIVLSFVYLAGFNNIKGLIFKEEKDEQKSLNGCSENLEALRNALRLHV